MLDFIRIACAVPDAAVADVENNVAQICRFMEEADQKQVDLLVFPELSITGASCGDLFWEDTLYQAAEAGLERIRDCSRAHPEMTVVVGLPRRMGRNTCDCAGVIRAGELLGVSKKGNLTEAERRWFDPDYACEDEVYPLGEGAYLAVRFGSALEQGMNAMNTASAQVIVNLAAEPEVAGGRARRRGLAAHQSEILKGVYVYCSAGMMESTQDGVYSGHSLICQAGEVLAENGQLTDSGYLLVTDCDLGKVAALRRRSSAYRNQPEVLCVPDGVSEGQFRSDGSLYHINKLPFIPETKQAREEYCREVFQIQVSGLKRRLKAINCNPVLGISGGLDSTLALLVAVEAVRQLGWDTKRVYGITMPCFGTSDRTYRNAWDLMEKLGITSKEISIKEAVTQHFADIGHDPNVRNTTYENAQARERTQILMDYSGTVGGIVVGTGDLSELALGWCTYNGDHMSMYGVNGSVPKTLIRWIVEAVADLPAFAPAKATLMDVLDTPISPELLPPDASGQIAQQTEDLVGPYALHDFFLYHVLKYGFGPKKIYALACRAFAQDFDGATIKKWLGNFYRRFFTQQFKRSCQPDGVKALELSLSPRTDWKMPSEAGFRLWMKQVEEL